jgi:hypothetical protein
MVDGWVKGIVHTGNSLALDVPQPISDLTNPTTSLPNLNLLNIFCKMPQLPLLVLESSWILQHENARL